MIIPEENKEYLHKMGQRIRDLRIKKGLTQDELAQKMGYTSRSTIDKIEKGLVDLPQSKLTKLTSILDTTHFYLLGWTESPEECRNEISIVSEKYGTMKYYIGDKDTKAVIELLEKYFKG